MKQVQSIYILSILLIAILGVTSCGDDHTASTNTSSDDALFTKLDSSKTNLLFQNTIRETKQLHHFVWDAFYNGAGVATGDINNDGLDDIFLTSNYGVDRLFLNEGNLSFKDITSSAKIGGEQTISSGVTMADVNSDGYLDIYVCKYGFSENPDMKTNLLYINNKDNTFTESAAQYGLDNKGYSIQASFFDYDIDGDLDMFLMNQPSNTRKKRQVYDNSPSEEPFINEYTSDRLYQNQGGTFVDVTKKSGIENFAFGLGHNVSDLTGDGLPDIYVANDYYKPDFYYINQGDGTFSEELEGAFNHISNFSMGMDIADINNDNLLDIGVLDMAGATHYRSKTNMPSMNPAQFYEYVDKGYHYQYMHNTLQLNQGNNKFSDIAFMAGVAKTDWSWSLLMADFDNDGMKDIHITNGILKDIRNSDYLAELKAEIQRTQGRVRTEDIFKMLVSTPMDNYLYHNDGHQHFTNKAEEWGVADKGFSNGAAYADLDNDGDLDLIVNNVNRNVSLYENHATDRFKNNAIRIKPVSSSKKNVVNTKVTIYNNGQSQVSLVIPSKGFMSSSEAVAHFGIGKDTKIDSCIIVWPDNTYSKHTDIKVNETVVYDMDKVDRKPLNLPKEEAPMILAQDNILDYRHQENEFDPFGTQLLLPYELSEMGPFISQGDVNGDKLNDLYIGGAAEQVGQLYLGSRTGKYKASNQQVFLQDKGSEDGRSCFFDADGDGDLDLYVCSGGYEITDSGLLQDRLYINNGKGSFTKSKSLPNMPTSSSTPLAMDIDKDGDLDLAVFGRMVPGKYPQIPHSYLLINEGGRFEDQTTSMAPQLEQLGMITDAVVVDYDQDGDDDAVVVGEWMAPTFLMNNNGQLEKANNTDSNMSGIYFSISAGDVDGDGDQDFVLGNIGKNNKWKASTEKPFKLYADDFDNNGGYDIVLSNYSGDKEVPVRGRQCSSEQIPEISDKYKTFDGFATASIDEIYNLNNAQALMASNFLSGILRNNNGSFEFEPFDTKVQMSPLNASELIDINSDGILDIVGVGNLFSTEVETTRFDAGNGVILLGNGKGGFTWTEPRQSGFYARFDAKDMVVNKLNDKKQILVVNNNNAAQVYSN